MNEEKKKGAPVLNLVDRAVSFFSPASGVKRAAARVSLRAYEATETSRLRRNRNDPRSPDQVNEVSIEKLRLQARYIDENHDIGKSVLNTLVNFVVGDGIRTLPQMKDTSGNSVAEVNKKVSRLWNEWSRRPEVTGQYSWLKLQRLAARTYYRDGEVFGQHILGNAPGLDHGTAVAYSLEMIEPDYCPVGYTSVDALITQGIKKNSWGAAEMFYFYKAFPSELSGRGLSAFALDSRNLRQVDARSIIHIKNVERLGQTRGVSVFASVFKRLDDLKDYEESERTAARIAAAFALAITKPWDAPPSQTSAPNWREMDIAPGIIVDNLAPGESVEAIKNERPNNALTEFRAGQLRAVSGGTNAGYSSIAKSYEGSYSSQRQELIENHGVYMAMRLELISMFHEPTYRNFIDTARVQGLINLSGIDPLTIYDAEFVGRGVPYIQPAQEVTADEKAINIGIKTRQQVILEKGGDPDKVNDLLLKDKEFTTANGLTLNTTSTPPVEKAAASTGSNDSGGAGSTSKGDDETGNEKTGRGLPGDLVSKRGRRGQRGPVPAHKIIGNKLQFQQPNGDWGAPLMLVSADNSE